MIEINLLPHREAKRVADLRQTGAVLILGLILEGGLIGFLNSDVKSDLEAAKLEVGQLQKEIEDYKPQQAQVEMFKKTRTELEEKLSVIDGLDQGRKGPVRLMDELARYTPDRLWLTEFNTTGNSVKIKGESLDTGTVADLLRGLNESAYFRNVDLDRTTRGKEVDGVMVVSFVITADFVPGAKSQPSADDKDA